MWGNIYSVKFTYDGEVRPTTIRSTAPSPYQDEDTTDSLSTNNQDAVEQAGGEDGNTTDSQSVSTQDVKDALSIPTTVYKDIANEAIKQYKLENGMKGKIYPRNVKIYDSKNRLVGEWDNLIEE